jgi:hypothetical protein
MQRPAQKGSMLSGEIGTTANMNKQTLLTLCRTLQSYPCLCLYTDADHNAYPNRSAKDWHSAGLYFP